MNPNSGIYFNVILELTHFFSLLGAKQHALGLDFIAKLRIKKLFLSLIPLTYLGLHHLVLKALVKKGICDRFIIDLMVANSIK
jgi:hypothetical protein